MAVYNILKEALSSEAELVLPSDVAYSDSIARWNALAVRNAGAVVYPKTTEDIVTIVKFVTANSIDLAVKCGGHSAGGASSSEGGLVLDLSKHFATVTPDKSSKIIRAGGGATWHQLDTAAHEAGLATVGGTVSMTGIGGLSLHGGFGWLSGLYGLVVDNLVEFTVVTATGEILKSNATTNTNLFWALRGGGGNFAIVTEFVYKAYEITEAWGGLMVFPLDMYEQVVEIASRVCTAGGKAAQSVIVAVPPGAPGLAVLTGMGYFGGSEEEAKEFFQPMFDLPNCLMVDVKMRPYTDFNHMADGFFPNMRRYVLKMTYATPPYSIELITRFREKFTEFHAEHPQMASCATTLELHDHHKRASVAEDLTAFPNRSLSNLMGVMLIYDNPEDDELAMKFANENLALINSYEKDAQGVYSNLDTEIVPIEVDNVTKSKEFAKSKKIFGSNYARLQAVKAKYDPKGMFSKWNPIQPLDIKE